MCGGAREVVLPLLLSVVTERPRISQPILSVHPEIEMQRIRLNRTKAKTWITQQGHRRLLSQDKITTIIELRAARCRQPFLGKCQPQPINWLIPIPFF